jgi:hypothetical protein
VKIPIPKFSPSSTILLINKNNKPATLPSGINCIKHGSVPYGDVIRWIIQALKKKRCIKYREHGPHIGPEATKTAYISAAMRQRIKLTSVPH